MLQKVILNQKRILSCVQDEDEQRLDDFDFVPSDKFPLKTEDDFEFIEEYLSIKVQRREAVKYFTNYYAEDWDEWKFTGKLLSKLISNDFAKSISWEGTEGSKIAFKTTRLNHTIRLAVLKIFNSDLSQSEKKVQRWFYTSKQRGK
ncbi:uncharacterized protein LOC127748767 [Frankliniella occidentalis]|uniref:Uncharacterized protein LOC127748767 n=1 Tax=Frankliniella occidentalis TaxID=133901 RepID=A0A9C6TN22_FRAOC|nr:uncharacterized protein LOC127748767 [Frankliniella occidentalis]